jgi:hypothetical protein
VGGADDIAFGFSLNESAQARDLERPRLVMVLYLKQAHGPVTPVAPAFCGEVDLNSRLEHALK